MATVLVVDDAAFMRMMLRDILKEAGHQVIGEAGTGNEAVQLYATLKPALVTMDLVMPEKSGMDALKEILALDAQARVIMVSAVGQQETAEEALRLGARAYLLKPFQPDQVRARIADVLAS